MTETFRAVFLSYASQDTEVAQRICEALRANGIEVWFDQSELRGGDAWDRQIRKQIHECLLFVPIVSANTQARLEGYFRLEWRLAVERTRLMADAKPFLVPVVIDATEERDAEVPDSFRTVQWTRLAAKEAFPGFVQRVARLLSPEPAQAAAGSAVPISEARGLGHAVPAASSARSRWTRRLSTLAVGLALVAAAYFSLDRLALREHSLSSPSTPAIASRLEGHALPTSDPKSIAVLPFIDLSEKKDQEYFSDGLTEELLDLLAKTPGLRVIARTSSFSFKGKSEDIPTIGRKLNVANVLEGSVRKSGNRFRVTTQLIRASSGEHLWSETYDRELKDVFALQDEIAAAVVAQLKLRLGTAYGPSARRTSNAEAYDEYLLGRQFYGRGTLDGWNRAIEAYRRAIVLDPAYVAPYEGLAWAEYQVAGHDPHHAGGYERALAAAAKAVELGPDDPSAYAARGFVRYSIAWDWAGAQADLNKAVEVDAGDARFQLSYADLLASTGRVVEAIAGTRKAIALDPLNATGWTNLTQLLLFTGDVAGAEEASRRALEISPESTFALNNQGWVRLIQGRAQDALTTFSRIDEEAFRLCGIAMAEHTLEHAEASQRALDGLIGKYARDSAYQIAEAYAWRGERDRTFEWLERAYARRDGGLTLIIFDPLLDSVRGDPRYSVLLGKMNLMRTELPGG